MNTREREALLRRLGGPAGITALALLLGWLAMLFAYKDQWLGLILALLTTIGAFIAIRRGDVMARQRRARLEAAVSAAAARNRELELLRRLGSILLGVRSSGELLEEVVQLAAGLLEAEGAAILLIVEEGRFLKVSAGAGLLRVAEGSLVPVERSLAGWSVLSSTAEGGWYQPNGLMVLAPGAFLIIGLLIWALRTWKTAQVEPEEA